MGWNIVGWFSDTISEMSPNFVSERYPSEINIRKVCGTGPKAM